MVGLSVASALGLGTLRAQDAPLNYKTIPGSGEAVPPVGIGTIRWGVGSAETVRAPLKATLRLFAELGGRIVDTAAGYGTSEVVIGDLTAELGIRSDLFLATKTDLRGQKIALEGLKDRFGRLKTEVIDLMQVHNLVNIEAELAEMSVWKAAGRIRYLGATISTQNQFAEMERAIDRYDALDFVQLNYSLGDRKAAERLLPAAADRGLAVLINVPFGSGRLFDMVEGQDLPDWASEIDCASWAQFFLKYIVSHPAVTAAIPGTRREQYVIDNLGAARGAVPDAAMRRRQEQFFDSLV